MHTIGISGAEGNFESVRKDNLDNLAVALITVATVPIHVRRLCGVRHAVGAFLGPEIFRVCVIQRSDYLGDYEQVSEQLQSMTKGSPRGRSMVTYYRFSLGNDDDGDDDDDDEWSKHHRS